MSRNVKKSKSVYVALSADLLHHGHTRLINEASKLGTVTVGLLTDDAIKDHKRLPILNFDMRRELLLNLRGVDQVVPQDQWSYSSNILKLKPDFFVHGDDWIHSDESYLRDEAIYALSSYGGQLIEVPFTPDINSTAILNSWTRNNFAIRNTRTSEMRRLIATKKLLRFIECHSPLSALMIENLVVNLDSKNLYFDGFWSSSLTDSTLLGMPDNESVSIFERVSNVQKILHLTSKPIIFDADTGGHVEHFKLNCRLMENSGISAIVIEDKIGLKHNSLLGHSNQQQSAEPEDFANKIRAGIEVLNNNDSLLFGRIESLILDLGIEDAIQRAQLYVGAGANGILIHSRSDKPDEVLEFARIFRGSDKDTILACVPTTYNSVHESDLKQAGFNIVIYANQMLRASYSAMKKAAISILSNGRSFECEPDLSPINEILGLLND